MTASERTAALTTRRPTPPPAPREARQTAASRAFACSSEHRRAALWSAGVAAGRYRSQTPQSELSSSAGEDRERLSGAASRDLQRLRPLSQGTDRALAPRGT